MTVTVPPLETAVAVAETGEPVVVVLDPGLVVDVEVELFPVVVEVTVVDVEVDPPGRESVELVPVGLVLVGLVPELPVSEVVVSSDVELVTVPALESGAVSAINGVVGASEICSSAAPTTCQARVVASPVAAIQATSNPKRFIPALSSLATHRRVGRTSRFPQDAERCCAGP